MLVNIHFQKYNRYKFLESYLYCNNGDLELRQYILKYVSIQHHGRLAQRPAQSTAAVKPKIKWIPFKL